MAAPRRGPARLLAVAALVAGLWVAGGAAALVARGADEPTQIHLSPVNADGSAITVSWVTQTENSSVVHLGTESGVYREFRDGEVPERYIYSSKYQGPYVSPLLHHLTVSGLQPATLYFYRCGAPTPTGGYSAEFAFRTPPAPAANASVSFAIVGDIGQTEHSKYNVEDMLADGRLTALVILGDLSYADSSHKPKPKTPCGQERWDSWFQMMQPLATTMPILTLPGNHEIEDAGDAVPATQTPFLAYSKRLRMPGGGANRLFYSCNYGSVHLVMLNSYMAFNPGSPQHEFLAKDLAAVDRAVTPWLLVCFHAPWYHSNKHHVDEPEEAGMQAAMEELLYRHEVDLVFSGHVHNYERTHPVYRNGTAPGAPTYLTVGDGGNREGPALGWRAQPEWSAFRLDQEEDPLRIFGHGRVEVHNGTHLHFKWRCLRKSPKKLADSVWFVKNAALPGPLRRGVAAFPA
eukprot:EG_transcript_11834